MESTIHSAYSIASGRFPRLCSIVAMADRSCQPVSIPHERTYGSSMTEASTPYLSVSFLNLARIITSRSAPLQKRAKISVGGMRGVGNRASMSQMVRGGGFTPLPSKVAVTFFASSNVIAGWQEAINTPTLAQPIERRALGQKPRRNCIASPVAANSDARS